MADPSDGVHMNGIRLELECYHENMSVTDKSFIGTVSASLHLVPFKTSSVLLDNRS